MPCVAIDTGTAAIPHYPKPGTRAFTTISGDGCDIRFEEPQGSRTGIVHEIESIERIPARKTKGYVVLGGVSLNQEDQRFIGTYTRSVRPAKISWKTNIARKCWVGTGPAVLERPISISVYWSKNENVKDLHLQPKMPHDLYICR